MHKAPLLPNAMLKSVVRPTRVHIVCATYKTIAAKNKNNNKNHPKMLQK